VIDHETFCRIHDCHDRQGLTIQQTARALGLHPRTVATWLARSCFEPRRGGPRRSVLDPFKPRITQLLDTHPCSAQQIFLRLREEGYGGGMTILRDYLRRIRPTKRPVYLKLHSAPSECALVNWAQFGHIAIGRACRPLTAFVMVLSYSRQIFLRFFLNAGMENFLRGHVQAFESWCGVPRIIVYDNLRRPVLGPQGDDVRFHPILLEFAGHYRYEPRPVAIARGNERGRMERAIRYLRTSLFAAREFVDLDDTNAQADVWCRDFVGDRCCPERSTHSVRAAFAEKTHLLLKLPCNAYQLRERVPVTAGKPPYVRFDLNDYSIPHTHVRRQLTVLADLNEVCIVDDQHVLACHRRSYDRGAQI
jgi:transposase